MSRTITAMFDTRADAEAGAERLRQAGVDASHIHVHDQSTHQTSSAYSTHQDRGTWASIKNAFLPDEDRHTYEEGIRRGGAVLTADVADHHADDAVRALEEANSVDLDERSQNWRNEGWDYPAAGASTGLFGGRDDSDLTTRGSVDHDTTARGTFDNDANEQVIPVVEEQLVVGKRDVSSGGARIRSYVSEVPVHEQVRLREEHVNVTRRAVDQPLSSVDADAFRDREINVTATSEEAVIGKKAHVVEEVVVSKTSGERTEEVNDTVRRTEVEVDEDNNTFGTRRDI
jgi:uncharacterized protein (TIGR02271 family)